MPTKVVFHPSAEEELRAAFLWYFHRNPIVADAFKVGIDRAVSVIGESPSRWPKQSRVTRRFVLPLFPFTLIYRETKKRVEVLAVAHQKRRPGYWKKR